METNKQVTEITHWTVRIPGLTPEQPQYLTVTSRDALAILLTSKAGKGETEKQRQRIREYIGKKYIAAISFVPQPTANGLYIGTQYKLTLPAEMAPQLETIKAHVHEFFASPALQQLVRPYITGDVPMITMDKPAEILHYLPRSLQKDIARNTGNASEPLQGTLFNLPLQNIPAELERQRELDPEMQREYWSQKAGLLAQLFMQKYQGSAKDPEGYVLLRKPTALAKEIDTDSKYFKRLLLVLTQYRYPHTQYVQLDGKAHLGVKFANLFDITLLYDSDRKAALDPAGKWTSINDTINLILQEEPKAIRLKPTPEYIHDLEGKGLGSIRVTDNFLAAIAGLTVYAYKLLAYIYNNKPEPYKIKETNLLEHLNLYRYKKSNGAPRLRKIMRSALQELKDKGHLKTYSIEARADGPLYSWEYTDKYIKHQDKYLNPDGSKYLDLKDETIPLEDRRKHMAGWLKKKGQTPKAAAAIAAKKLPK